MGDWRGPYSEGERFGFLKSLEHAGAQLEKGPNEEA